MSVTRTYTVTVVGGNPSDHPYHNFGSSNKYAIDGSTATENVTLYLAEGRTYRFDQSDSSNSAHPLRFSTTANGTHGGGSEYTTGVTTNGTPGEAGAYTEISVAVGAPTLYYYCTNHSGMGWTANTPVSTYSRTFNVTVVSTGSGNKYVINGVQQDTVNLAEGYTYIFDQSDSSNSGHPFRFSTTSGGTHGGGSEYTTGVTTEGTPGNDGAYTQITVAASAPTLYYYCQVHAAMGGQANTPASDTWGLLSWNYNSWGSQDEAIVLPTGQSATSSVGDGTNMGVPQQGWGGKLWGDNNWGELPSIDVFPTGVSATVSLNADGLLSFQSNGWGRNTWNAGPFGESFNPVISLSGFGLTSSVGDGTNMGVPQQGWNGKSWGDNNWGELSNIDVFPSGVSMSASI